jgi:putative ATPase
VDLFAEQRNSNRRGVQPLAVRMRPRTLDEFIGQSHLVGEGKLLRRTLEADRMTSAVFYGPPGTGKTTLALIIARVTQAHFEEVNAAAVGVKEVRALLGGARDRLETSGQRTILFVDELHRFHRGQQDVLLSDVEDGVVILIGATTENPFFAINAPLVSRSQIFQFEPLSIEDIKSLMLRALVDRERGLGAYQATMAEDALEHLAVTSDGDARRALTALEIAVLSQADRAKSANPIRSSESRTSGCADSARPEGRGAQQILIDLEAAAESIQRKAIQYDRTGDAKYDAISAMIKSIRGGDPDAAVYWMARMLEAGEDPRYVARRLVILAAEDVGNADPQGLILAQAAASATEMVGMPECQLLLGQAAVYLACAPKSNASAVAIWSAMEDVREGRTLPVPKHLKSTGYRGAERLGHGVGYRYPHDAPEGIVQQDYLGVERTYYVPTDRGYEARLKAYLEQVRREVEHQDGAS